MFAVLGYQTTNDALFAALRSTRHHLDMHGLFVFDVWYGPAVLSQKPRDRVKIVTDGGDRVIRLACVSTRPGRNIVEVSLRVLRLRGDRLVEETEEVHPMRYFFRPEMEFFLSQAGFDLVEFCAFGKPGAIPDDTTWNVSIVARAV
jgi:hypothetical protein